MATLEVLPEEIWFNIMEQLMTSHLNFLNPKHKSVRAIASKWQCCGTFKIVYPFLRMVSHDLKRISEEVKSKSFNQAHPYVPLKGFDMCIAMAAGGHLSALKYLHENGAKWTEETCNYAALHGHLTCLKYAHENGCKWSSETCALAALNGHFDCLKYAHDNRCIWDTECCSNAAQRGDLEMIQYLTSNGCKWSAQTAEAAARYGHLELLKYLNDHGCPNGPFMAQMACLSGKIEILKYVHERGALLNPQLSVIATSVNSLGCLQYLHESGVDWHVDVVTRGIQNNSQECLQYALDNDCPFNAAAVQSALKQGNISVLRRLDQLDPNFIIEMDIYMPLSYALQGRSLECLKFLIEEKGVLVTDKQRLIESAQFISQEIAAYLTQLDPKYESKQQQQAGFPWLPY